MLFCFFFFFKQKTAYEITYGDWSSDVCSSDLARRQARRWAASLNVWVTSFSAVFFLSFTLLLSFWIGSAFRFALIGLGFGAILALLGLAMTRWESRSEGLFYTPSRWLAVVVTLAIAARFIYGWWHATHSGSNAPAARHWL